MSFIEYLYLLTKLLDERSTQKVFLYKDGLDSYRILSHQLHSSHLHIINLHTLQLLLFASKLRLYTLLVSVSKLHLRPTYHHESDSNWRKHEHGVVRRRRGYRLAFRQSQT